MGMAAGDRRRHQDEECGEDAFLISLFLCRQVALRWARQLGIAAVTKTEKVARMQENLDIFDFSLSSEEMEAISHLNKNLRLFGNPARFP